MCFPLIAGDSPGAPRWPDKAVLKYRQSTVSKQSEKERECCSGNSSGMGRDLAAVLHLENVTGAASEHRLGPRSLGRLRGRLLHSVWALGDSGDSGLRDSGGVSAGALGSTRRGRALLIRALPRCAFSACCRLASAWSFRGVVCGRGRTCAS